MTQMEFISCTFDSRSRHGSLMTVLTRVGVGWLGRGEGSLLDFPWAGVPPRHNTGSRSNL